METQFSWTKQWYPIIPLSYLDPSQPSPVTLLGKKLVIWRDKNKNWILMDDTCPHKLAQLSKGSINDSGDLTCRHHGWCFDGAGRCTKIPMLIGSEAHDTACNSSRSQVTTYPTQVRQNLLWVWPDDSETALTDSNSKQPATIPEGEVDISDLNWHMTEVPVGYTVSVESSFDPSHAEFLHEGIGLFSPKTAIPIQRFESVGEMSADGGFTLSHTGYNLFNKDMDAKRNFTPPTANTTIYHYPSGKTALFQLYFVPTQPGYCRYIGTFVSDTNFVEKNFLIKILPKYFQIGLQHLSTYKLSDQDLTIMRSQEVNQSSSTQKWQKEYFLPSPADVGIVTFRRWLDEFAGGNPFKEKCIETSLKYLNDEQLYDRWHRHSKYCPNCRNSVLLLEKVQFFCKVSTLLLTLLTLVMILIGSPITSVLFSAMSGVLALSIALKAQELTQLFFSSIPKRGLPVVRLY